MFKKFVLISMIAMITASGLQAQEYFSDKKSSFFGLSATLSSSGGDLYEDNSGNRFTNGTIAGSWNYFVAKQFFIGGAVATTFQAQGANDATVVGIGPQMGFAFGKPDSRSLPFLTVGYRFEKYTGGNSSMNGSDVMFGLGFLFKAVDHLGVTVEAGYHLKSVNSGGVSASGNVFMVGVGLTGLLF